MADDEEKEPPVDDQVRDYPTPGYLYKVKSGDKLESISRKAYGISASMTLFDHNQLRSNDPARIFPGEILFIPLKPDTTVTEEEEVTLSDAEPETDGVPETYWTIGKTLETQTISRPGYRPPQKGSDYKNVHVIIDGMEVPAMSGRFGCGFDDLARTWNCTIPWVPGKNPELDRVTKRGSFADSELYFGDRLMAKGRLYGRTNAVTPNSSTKTLTFYSRTADMIDSNIPPDTNAEIKNSTLEMIVKNTAPMEEYKCIFVDPSGDSFENVKVQNLISAAEYYQNLAAQRGLFMSADETGRIVFQKLKTDSDPVAFIEYEKSRNAIEYQATFDDRKRFMKIVAVSYTKDTDTTEVDSSVDTGVKGNRILFMEAKDSNVNHLATAAEWAMLCVNLEAYSLPLQLNRWTDDNGDVWRPNTAISLLAPTLDVPEAKKFIIRKCEFAWTPKEYGVQLSVIPPLYINEDGVMAGAV